MITEKEEVAGAATPTTSENQPLPTVSRQGELIGSYTDYPTERRWARAPHLRLHAHLSQLHCPPLFSPLSVSGQPRQADTMNADRTMLTDRQWIRIEPLLTGKKGDPGRTGNNNRATLEGILHVLRTGCPWRDLPEEQFGKPNTVFKRFRRWVKKGVFHKILLALGSTYDLSVVSVDGTISQVHQHAAGARKFGLTPELSRRAQGIGVSRGGLSTKIMALVDRNGKTVQCLVVPGNRSETPELFNLLEGIPLEYINELLGDKAYDSDDIRDKLAEAGIIATIPPRSNRINPASYDKEHYKGRHLPENVFADMKQFRGIATRYVKLLSSFEGFINLACWYLATKEIQRGPSKYL